MIRNLLALTCLCAAAFATAAERVEFGDDAAEVAAYERAVSMNPAHPRDGDQVRMWYANVMNGDVRGLLVTPGGTTRCTLKYINDGKGLLVQRGQCGTQRRHQAEAARVIAKLEQVAAFSGKSIICEVWDGWDGQVTGVINGKVFAFSISNTHECADTNPEAKVVNELMELVSEAYKPEKKN